MNSQDLAKRLRSHANLPGGAVGVDGLCMHVWSWRSKGAVLSIAAPLSDLLHCLQLLNAEPRTRERPLLSDSEAQSAAYSLSCIIGKLASVIRSARACADAESKQRLEWALDVTAHAWSQVLAGDIEDIIQDLRDSGLVDDDLFAVR